MDVREKLSSEKRLIDYYYLAEKIECPGQPLVYWDDIEAAPTIDAVPVVRCRECKHAWIHPCGYVYCHRDGRNAYEMTFNLDSFCSYGERKEGADNG